jgi:serine-type D-Ala-D-Ala carboxypeptidase/endopeptidase (penicillin-binding protein 4)
MASHLKKLIVIILISFFLVSCISGKKVHISSTQEIFKSNFVKNIGHSHSGFALYDPEENKYIEKYNYDKYFIPASNMKLFTFFAGYKMLQDSVPGLFYSEDESTLTFWGTGDPSFLHPNFPQQKIYEFLKNQNKELYFNSDNFKDQHFGSGWAWNDYYYSYAAEKAPFPIFSNLLTVNLFGNKSSLPLLNLKGFNLKTLDKQQKEVPVLERNIATNELNYNAQADSIHRKLLIPLKYSSDLFISLLSDTLKRDVRRSTTDLKSQATKVLYSQKSDSLYSPMLKDSDNFIAEQILLIASSTIGEDLNSKKAIDFMQKNYLKDFSDSIRWVDGSGLSRYNLITPRVTVELLEYLYENIDQERLLSLFPTGGKSGTIKRMFLSETPYVFAKTGTLSNTYSLSGYIKTKSGKILIFSCLNNHFMVQTSEVRKEIENVLKQVYENY